MTNRRHQQKGYVPSKEEMAPFLILALSIVLLIFYLIIPFHPLIFLYPSLFLTMFFIVWKLKFFYAVGSPTSDVQAGTFLSIIAMGQIDRAKEFLDKRPLLIESRDAHGQTPLHYAAVRGDLAMINILLTYGADVMAKDNDGRTALKLVIQIDDRYGDEKHASVISFLRKHGTLD
jgi:ankyrin repeat protein